MRLRETHTWLMKPLRELPESILQYLDELTRQNDAIYTTLHCGKTLLQTTCGCAVQTDEVCQ